MKIKTGLKAGDGSAGGGGGEVVTNETVQAAVNTGLETAGLPALQESMTAVAERQSQLEKKLERNSHRLESGSYWAGDEVFTMGIPASARPGIKSRVQNAFAANRSEDEVFPGQNAARVFRAHCLSEVSRRDPRRYGSAMTAVQIANKLYGENHIVTTELALLEEGKPSNVRFDVNADMLRSDRVARVGVTIPDAFLPGYVDFLRPRSVFLAAGPVDANLERGKFSIITQTSGTSFGWVASEDDVPARTSLDFGKTDLVAKYLKGLVVWSIRALERSNVVSDALILDDMLSGGADAIDAAGLLSDGTLARPKGLRYLIHSDHIGVATVLTAGQTNIEHIENISLDFRTKLNLVVAVANITPQRMVLFMSYREYLYFLEKRTDTGAKAWPEVGANGTLMGMPIFWTGRIATTGDPSSIGSTIIGADMSQVLYGEEEGLNVDVSFEASVTDGSGVYNLWERSAGAAKLSATVDIGMRRPKAGFVITEVNYGGLAMT